MSASNLKPNCLSPRRALLFLGLVAAALASLAALVPARSEADSAWRFYCRAPVPGVATPQGLLSPSACNSGGSWGNNNVVAGNYTWQTAFIADTWHGGCQVGLNRPQDVVWAVSVANTGAVAKMRFGCYAASWSGHTGPPYDLFPYATHSHTGYTHFLIGKVGPCRVDTNIWC